MKNHDWKRVSDPDDPLRCQGITARGQCWNQALEDLDYCPAHAGRQAKALKVKKLNNYKLNKFKQRTEELANSDGITSLRDEVSLLRLLIEERVNQCQDSHDLLLVSGPLSDLVVKVEKLVVSCLKLESKLGNHLDKTKIIQFAQTVIEIISSEINDPDQLDAISDKILQLFTEKGEIT